MKAILKGPNKVLPITLRHDLGLVVRQSNTSGKLMVSISPESYREILANVMLAGLSLADFGITNDAPNFQQNTNPDADDEITIS